MRQGWHSIRPESPEVMRFSRSMKGTLTQDVSSASSAKDGDRRGERWNVSITIVSGGDYRRRR
ncbi:MAG TPA: hypothetical protein VMW91_10845 [Desulfosporosinus sp.]|nr:hypothetical protein [Desulfosporosinus sp.]